MRDASPANRNSHGPAAAGVGAPVMAMAGRFVAALAGRTAGAVSRSADDGASGPGRFLPPSAGGPARRSKGGAVRAAGLPAALLLALAGLLAGATGAVAQTVPTVSSVALTSDPNEDGRTGDDDTYAIGDTIEATVTFSAAVTVTGTPQLTLDIGGTNRTANYSSGDSTTLLVFTYTVAEDDEDTDGIAIAANQLTLNGGVIMAGTAAANLSHGALAADSGHKVDGVRPTFVSAETSTDGTSITVTFSENISSANHLDFLVNPFQAGTVTGATVTDDVTVVLSLNTAVLHDQTVTVRASVSSVRDTAGNGNANTGNRAVDNKVPDTDATLSALTLAERVSGVTLHDGTVDVALSPTFASGTTSYTARVEAARAVTFTATANDSLATCEVVANGVTIIEGADCSEFQVPLKHVTLSTTIANTYVNTTNDIEIRVTAEDGTTTETYTVTVERRRPLYLADARLASLTLHDGTADVALRPPFAQGGLFSRPPDYYANVAGTVSMVTLTFALHHDGAIYEVLDGSDTAIADAAPSTPGYQVPLAVGGNTIKVKVRAPYRPRTKTYIVTVNRPGMTDATLSGLWLNNGRKNVPLMPGFAPNAFSYIRPVPHEVSEVTVTHRTNATNATVEMLDSANQPMPDVDDSAHGHQVRLAEGDTTVKVRVTAEDGTTTRTYTLRVKRLPSGGGGLPASCAAEPLGMPQFWCSILTVGESGGSTGFSIPDGPFGGTRGAFGEMTNPSVSTLPLGYSIAYHVTDLELKEGKLSIRFHQGLSPPRPDYSRLGGGVMLVVGGKRFALDDAEGSERKTEPGFTQPIQNQGYRRFTWPQGVNWTPGQNVTVRLLTPRLVSPYELDLLRERLTAEFHNVALQHNSPFTFEVRFSEAIAISRQTMIDHVFTVTNGEVTAARRLDNEHDEADGLVPNREWEITVDSFSDEAVTVVLPETTDCEAAGAVCTEDGRPLSGEIRAVVPGPASQPTEQTGLAAEFVDVPESHGGAEFTFKVRFSESFELSYLTMRDAALTVTNGRVTGARRLDNPHHEHQGMQPNREWEIRVTPDSGAGDVTVTLPATADCEAAGAVCTGDGTMLSGAVTATVPRAAVEDTPAEPPAPPLRGSLANVPSEHDGESAFTFEVRFSEAFRLSYLTMRDSVLTVTNGRVIGARRLDNPHHEHQGMQPNRSWEVRVRPDSASEDVRIVLPGTTDCGASGAVCTEDGRKLSNAVSATVAGPPSLSIADAKVREAAVASLDFTVSLSRAVSETVTVDWATSDGTATAGSDYMAKSGTLTFAAGKTSKTVSVAVLDDSVDEDSETLTVTLSNVSGANVWLADATATGTIENDDRMPQAWLARFGRTVAEQVVEAVEERFAASRSAGVEMTLAGHRLDSRPESGAAGAGAGQTGEAEARKEHEAQAKVAALADWLQGESRENAGQAGYRSRALAPRELLTGTSVALTAEASGGGSAALWARGAYTRFDGREDDLSLDGEVTSVMLGADWTREAWTAGLLMSHARGEGGYRGASEGEVTATLTGIYPYGRYMANERVTLWGLAGYGAGTLTLTPKHPETGEDERSMAADMDLAMGAVGLRGVAVKAPADGGIEFAVTSDAMAVRTSSAKTRGMAAARATVTRLRLGLEGSWQGLAVGAGGQLVPRLEIGVRHDGGDAETGFGLDAGGGVSWSDPSSGLSAEFSGRGLLTHESSGFRDRGFSGSLAWKPGEGSGRGPSLSLTQTVGAAATGGVDALLSRGTLAGLAANDNGDELENRRLELKLGYGFSAFADRFTSTPELGVGLSNGRREYSLGWRLNLSQGGPTALELGLEATRREYANDNGDPEHGVGFRVTARW